MSHGRPAGTAAVALVADPGERLSAFYDRRASEAPPIDPEAALRFRKAVGAASLREGERVLDLGAKAGGLAEHLRAAGIDVAYTGMDLSEENVQRAAGRGIVVRQADLSRGIPSGDGEYDCVFCLELLEHLPAPLALLCEIRRVLAPEGRAVLSAPNPYNWIELYRELRRKPDPEGHLVSLPTPIMVNALALAGMRLERRLGTHVRLPRTIRLLPTDSILARSWIYVARPEDACPFAGRAI
jgi:SAM-dependent methyltransferase